MALKKEVRMNNGEPWNNLLACSRLFVEVQAMEPLIAEIERSRNDEPAKTTGNRRANLLPIHADAR